MKKGKLLLNIISSGSLAGVLAILYIPALVYRLMMLAMLMSPGFPEWHRPDNIQLFYSISGLAVISAYIYMYFNHKALHLHKILWLLIILLTLASSSYSFFNSEDKGTLAAIIHII